MRARKNYIFPRRHHSHIFCDISGHVREGTIGPNPVKGTESYSSFTVIQNKSFGPGGIQSTSRSRHEGREVSDMR